MSANAGGGCAATAADGGTGSADVENFSVEKASRRMDEVYTSLLRNVK
jgi:hypothetical protein